MGYKSDCKAVMVFPEQVKYAVFLATLKEMKVEIDGVPAPLWEPADRDDCGGWFHDDERLLIGFDFNDVRWYPGYPAVAATMWMLGQSEAAGAAWAFCRLGENDDDVERQSGNDDDCEATNMISLRRFLAWAK